LSVLREKDIDLKSLLAENDYLPLEPFCSGEYDFISTEDWLKRLKNSKTLIAQRFDHQNLRFEEVIIIDE
jgi:hypothetical protein